MARREERKYKKSLNDNRFLGQSLLYPRPTHSSTYGSFQNVVLKVISEG